MSSISGIKYKSEFSELPFFNKKTAEVLIGKTGKNLDKKISRLLKGGDLIGLKKGLYLSERYLLSQSDRKAYLECLANILYSPSYLSLEYVLSSYDLIPEGVYTFTSVSLKSTRIFENKLGTFVYRNVKEELFCGYNKIQKDNFSVYSATKAKALFDFLYLKRNLSNDYSYELGGGLRINWEEFTLADVKEFEKFVNLSESKKMLKVLKNIKRIKNNNELSYNQIVDIDKAKNALAQQKAYLGGKYFVKNIGVFGSVARNQSISSSDIDLLVEFTKPVGFFHFSKLEDYLSDILGKKVDLVTKDALKPAIKESVLKDVVYV